LKKKFEIIDNPKLVNAVLVAHKSHSHLSKTFEGTAKNGVLQGRYSELALVNGIVLGYLKVQGRYDLVKGDMKIEILPNTLFWAMQFFALLGVSIFSFLGIKDHPSFIGTGFFLFFSLLILIFINRDSKGYLFQLKRICNNEQK
jgi:hypothetical protein